MNLFSTYSVNQEFPKNEIANPVGILLSALRDFPNPSLFGKPDSKLEHLFSMHILSSCE